MEAQGNLNTLGAAVGEVKPEAPAIAVDGKPLDTKLAEDAVRDHLRSLGCDYCREQLVRMAEMGVELDWRRPNASDTASMTTSPSQLAHDQNHDKWHAWNDELKQVKQAIRAQENKVYSELRARGFRGAALKAEAKKAFAKLTKIELPKMPQLMDSHPKLERPERPVKEARKSKGFKSKESEARSAARQASIERTLTLLNGIARAK